MPKTRRSPFPQLACGCLVVACVFLLIACEKTDPSVASTTSQLAQPVQSQPTQLPTLGTSTAVLNSPGPLCGAALQREGAQPAPKTESSLVAFPGHPPPQPLSLGKWQWVNLWASWCKPCRKEIPLLLDWRKRLQASLDVVFYSVDDASRSIRKFLGAQPDQGLRATFWLKPGPMRKNWLAEAGLPEAPRLPSHLLIDPQGRLRCVVTGAISEADFDRVKAIVERAQ